MQDGAALTAEERGAVGLPLSITYQSSSYRGLLRADRLELDLVASTSKRDGACVQTPTSTVAARATGDFLTGTIRHTSMTTGGAECAATACVSEHTFNAIGPSKPP